MKTKSRLIITITSLVLAVVASIVAVVAVLAARNATVNSDITVKYIASDIMGQVSLHTQRELEEDDSWSLVGSQEFDGTEEENGTANVKTISTEEYEISADGSHYAILRFSFTNDNQSKAYTADITVEENSDFEITYSKDNSTYGAKSSITVAANTESSAPEYYYVKISVPADKWNANIDATEIAIQWELNSVLN